MGSNIPNEVPTTYHELLDISGENMRQVVTENVYGPSMEFDVMLITEPLPVSTAALKKLMGTDGLPTDSDSSDSRAVNYVYKARVVDNGKSRRSPHVFCQDPCKLELAPVAARGKTVQFNDLHLKLYVRTVGDALRANDIVTVTMRKGEPYQFDLQFAFTDNAALKSSNSNPLSKTLKCSSITSLDYSQSQTGDGNNLPLSVAEAGIGKVIIGTPLSGLSPVVERELALWEGVKETEANIYSTLEKYWNNVSFSGWTPAGTPWSAAFISWVVNQVDPSFEGNAAHYYYAKAASEGKGGWSAWKIGEAKIQAQVGDILIYPRTGAGTTSISSHGDVVYKIENNTAFLAGGNLGNTAKIAAELSVDAEGNYSNFSKYTTILKKNGNAVSRESLGLT